MDTGNISGIKIRHNTKYLKICIRVTGKMEKEKDLEHFFIPMAADLKDTFSKI